MKTNYYLGLNPKTFLLSIIITIYTLNWAKANDISLPKHKIGGNCPFFISLSAKHLTCYGNSNGQAIAFASGGVSPYTYQWSPSGETSDTATGLSAGSYTLTVNDSSGCEVIDSIIISQPAEILITYYKTPVSCFNDSNGQLIANVSNGVSPFTFLWLPGGETSDTVKGLSSGTYSLEVTDSLGCNVIDTVSVTQPGKILVNFSISTPSCYGNSNGQATAVVSGGVSPYTYFWSPSGETSLKATGLSTGTYTLSVNDLNGCSMVDSIVISQPLQIFLNFSVTPISCYSDSNGQVIANITNGISPFTYQWSPDGDTSDTAAGLTSGNYTLNLTDNTGCNLTETVNVTQPAEILINFSVTPVTCFADSNGQVIATITNGVVPYTYLWSPGGGTSDTVTGLTSGKYILNVTDNTGCMDTSSVYINQPAEILVNFVLTPTTCGSSNGQVIANVINGYAPYTFYWSPNGTTSDTATGLSLGTYTLVVTDKRGCIDTTSVYVFQQTNFVINFSATAVSCYGDTNGQLIAVVANGIPPYTFSWSPSGETSDTASGLSSGLYTMTVTDSIGCIDTATIGITQPALLVVNANNDTICNGNSTTIQSYGSGGTMPYNYLWNNGHTSDTLVVSPDNDSCFTIMISDANQCTATAQACIKVTPLPVVNITPKDTIICFNPIDTTLLLIGSPGGGTFSGPGVSGTNFNNQISGLGTFSILYTYDSNRCSDTAIEHVTVSICSGMEDIAVNDGILIFPNPAKDEINVQWEIVSGQWSVELYDVTGQQLLEKKYISNTQSLMFRTQQLSNGVYFLEFQMQGGTSIMKKVEVIK